MTMSEFKYVVLHPLSTSNHNRFLRKIVEDYVVLHPLSTSNHNDSLDSFDQIELYCILFLHQTTT